MDNTPRLSAEQVHQFGEQRLESLMQNVSDLVIIIGQDGRVRYISPSVRKVAGYAPQQVIGHPVSEFLHPEEVQSSLAINQQAMAHPQQVYREELRFRDAQGTWRWCETLTQSFLESPAIGGLVVTLRDITERKAAQQTRIEQAERMRTVLTEAVRALAATLETRDPYTAGHERRVAHLSVAIGRRLGLAPDRLCGLELAAVVHDIGKIRVPAEILTRPVRLKDSEFAILREHVRAGYDILKDVHFPWPIARIVLEHHERLDGSGYPRGLKGDELLMESKILAVADVVEAMTSHRPYRPALGLEAALDQLSRERGTRLDAGAVDACIGLFREDGYALVV